ncbi:MAG: AbrB/MazE/SpoVT family DNA-binding domain-containing protein [Calditrichaeota bacterium]|nr:AbrB/MazE/SpoVT family DNA-binding domain-containing protein [Calditrichota bacterium]
MVSSRGSVVIPTRVRRKLRIKPGSRVRFRENKEGAVILEVEYDLSALKEILDPGDVHLTVEDMEQISATRMSKI